MSEGPNVTWRGNTALTISAIDHLVLNVRDVEASATWYERVLGMVREERDHIGSGIRTGLRFGQNKINLRPVSASTVEWITAVDPSPGTSDLCLLTSASSEAVIAHMGECAVEILLGPIARAGALGAIRSVYVRDPDGNLIELSTYG